MQDRRHPLPFLHILAQSSCIIFLQNCTFCVELNVKRTTAWRRAGYAFEKVINNNLCLQVFDHDRFSRDDIIGEVVVPLTPQDLVNGLTLWKDLQPSHGCTVRYSE